MIRERAGGVEIAIRVVPRAKKTILGGSRDGALVVRIAAPPVEGAANEALRAFFAELLDVPQRAVRITAGEHSRQKRMAIDGVTADAVRAKIRAG